MLDRIIRASLQHRWAILVAAFILLVAGGVLTSRLPVDIFPDLSAPTVTVITEVVTETLAKAGFRPADLDLLVMHQANTRILTAIELPKRTET